MQIQMLTTFFFLLRNLTVNSAMRCRAGGPTLEIQHQCQLIQVISRANFYSFPYEFYISPITPNELFRFPEYPLKLLTCYISKILISPFGFIGRKSGYGDQKGRRRSNEPPKCTCCRQKLIDKIPHSLVYPPTSLVSPVCSVLISHLF